MLDNRFWYVVSIKPVQEGFEAKPLPAKIQVQ